MMMHDLTDQARMISALPSDSYAATTQGAAKYVGDCNGRAIVHLDAEAAAAGGTLDLTIQDSEDGSTGWAAVNANALTALNSNTPATFTQVTQTAAVEESLALNLDLCAAYVRAVATIATAATVASVQIVAVKKYSG